MGVNLVILQYICKYIYIYIYIYIYMYNLDEFQSTGTHWIALYVKGNNGSASYDATYFENLSWTYPKRKENS